jgi:hypothetical protein
MPVYTLLCLAVVVNRVSSRRAFALHWHGACLGDSGPVCCLCAWFRVLAGVVHSAHPAYCRAHTHARMLPAAARLGVFRQKGVSCWSRAELFVLLLSN